MIEVGEVFERRLLAGLEQAAGVELPAAWRLEPKPGNLRPAAALVLRVAEAGCCREMADLLRSWAVQIGKNRQEREGGEKDLWLKLAAALEQLGGRREDGPAGLSGLRLWSEGAGLPIAELWQPLRSFLPAAPEVREPFLTEVGRVLLRALARSWLDAARAQEAGS